MRPCDYNNMVDKTKKSADTDTLFFVFCNLSTYFVELELETAGLSGRLVLSNDSVCSSLVELLANSLERFLGNSLVAGSDSSFKLLYSRFENCLLNLVTHCLGLDNLNTLFSRFNVRHYSYLLRI